MVIEPRALPISLPVFRFRAPLGAGILEKYYVSPLSILGHYFDVVAYTWARHFTQNASLDSDENEYILG